MHLRCACWMGSRNVLFAAVIAWVLGSVSIIWKMECNSPIKYRNVTLPRFLHRTVHPPISRCNTQCCGLVLLERHSKLAWNGSSGVHGFPSFTFLSRPLASIFFFRILWEGIGVKLRIPGLSHDGLPICELVQMMSLAHQASQIDDHDLNLLSCFLNCLAHHHALSRMNFFLHFSSLGSLSYRFSSKAVILSMFIRLHYVQFLILFFVPRKPEFSKRIKSERTHRRKDGALSFHRPLGKNC